MAIYAFQISRESDSHNTAINLRVGKNEGRKESEAAFLLSSTRLLTTPASPFAIKMPRIAHGVYVMRELERESP